MSIRHLLNSRIFFHFLVWWIFFSCFPGLISSAVVTLDSIEIFNTHEWIAKPTVYFVCKGENRTVLPDVTKTGVVYSFKGEESWQPLTKLESEKCKRCGFYEKDTIKSDDVYDEWEFCASDFKAPDGKYILFKEKELNVTFRCPECTSLQAASNTAPEKHDDGNGMHVAVVILISVLISTIMIIALVVAYKYWQKKKRQQDQQTREVPEDAFTKSHFVHAVAICSFWFVSIVAVRIFIFTILMVRPRTIITVRLAKFIPTITGITLILVFTLAGVFCLNHGVIASIIIPAVPTTGE